MKLFLLGLLFAVSSSFAATTTTPGKWTLYKGTAIVQPQIDHETLDQCVARADALKVATTYTCRSRATVRVTVPTTPPPVVPPATGWVLCAVDPQYCNFTGSKTVRFGLSTTASFIDVVKTGPVWCDISSFGGTTTDPAPGKQKSCWIGGTSTPPVDPPPPPPPPVVGTPGPRVSTFTPSGPITATAGQVISGLAISNPGGECIRVSGVSGVIIRDSKIGPCGRSGVLITGGASGTVFEHNIVSDSGFGAFVTGANNVTIRNNVFGSLKRIGEKYAHATEITNVNGGLVEGNQYLGSFPNDVLSGYESSNIRYINNYFDISQLDEPTGAAFTIGDSTTGNPGSNNYIAGNVVKRQVGGVPAGVFGSTANTILEKNCFTAGIQAYNYSGVFNGVTVRNNVINLANSFVPDTSVIAGWSTNINSTDCSLVPK